MSVVSPVLLAPPASSGPSCSLMMPASSSSMNHDIDPFELLFSSGELGEDVEESCCCQAPPAPPTPQTQESTLSSSSSPPSSTVCLSTHEMSSQVPECDIARISFYLRCCMLGCEVIDNRFSATNTATDFIDFTRSISWPSEYQNIVFRMAFEDPTYSFSNLQGRGIIHIDHHRQILPPGVSTMFLSSNTPEYALAMTRLYGSNFILHHQSNLVLPQRIMVCSLEWINDYYASPLERYVGRTFASTTTTAVTASNPTEATFVEDQNQPSHGCELQADVASSFTSTATTTTTSQKALHHQHHEYFDYGDDDHRQDAMVMDDIPIVAAVPIFDDGEPSPPSSSSSSSTATATEPKKKKLKKNPKDEIDVVSFSLIIPGQKVKFVNLEMDEMNDAVGIVQERRNNRVIVEVADHQCDYSVRVENLMIVL